MKTAFIYCLFLVLIQPAYAQVQPELRYGFGGAVHIEAMEELSIYYGLLFNPKIVFPLFANHAVSLGGTFTACLNKNETYNNNLTLNFPVLVDYNYGLGSSLTTTKPYGIFVGLGYQSVIYGLNTITSGYVYNAGFRFINFTPDKPVTTHKFQIEKEAFMRLYFPDDNIPNQIIAFGLQLNFPLLEVKQL